jgi:hypothetical protein
MKSNANNGRIGGGLGFLLGCLLCVAAPRCEAQGNLVPNGSFEEYDTCQQIMGFYTDTDGPLGWFSANGSPDYLMGCVPEGSANGVPQNQRTYQHAQDGESYVGAVTYQLPNGLREWVMAELAVPLVVGQTYSVSFYANAAWNGTTVNPDLYAASSHVGALFTMQPRPWATGDPWVAAGNFAHVYHSWLIADTVNWTLVSGTFVADSAYRYVILGNHFDNATTDTVLFSSYPWLPKAYTLIDNVCVSTDPNGCAQAHGIPFPASENVALYPVPVVDELAVRNIPRGSTARVADALGRVKWMGPVADDPWFVDVRAWPQGTYVLQVVDRKGSRSFKFVLTE